jgi:hypothetical protein
MASRLPPTGINGSSSSAASRAAAVLNYDVQSVQATAATGAGSASLPNFLGGASPGVEARAHLSFGDGSTDADVHGGLLPPTTFR